MTRIGMLVAAAAVAGAVGAQEHGEFAQGREVPPPAAALAQRDRVEPVNRMLRGAPRRRCCRG